MSASKRGYSRDFPVTGERTTYLLADIPSGFWLRVRAKAKREGVSMRALILQLLTTWMEDNR
jgi:hypothetical protein